jgi:replication factor A1
MPMEKETVPLLEEIIRALDTTDIAIDQDIIREELVRLLEFKVPPDEAKRSLLKKYAVSDIQQKKKIADIQGGERNIEIIARILNINLKIVNIRGEERPIFIGTMGDETGTKSFTSWDDFGINKGDILKITNCFVRIWQGMPQINFGPRSTVEQLNPETTDPLFNKELNNPTPLAEMKTGTSFVHTIFRIIEIKQQNINTKNGPKTIINGIGADSSAKLPFTSWIINPELIINNTIEIKNAHVRSWQGLPTINIDEFTTIHRSKTVLSADDIEEVLDPAPVKLNCIINRDGAFDVIVEGSIISIRPGSGLIKRCPECSRVISKNLCRVHGSVEGIDDLRIKSILDDGTGVLTIVLDSNLTQKVIDYSIEKAITIASTAMTPSVLEDEIKSKLLGRTMRLRGNMTKGEYGITLVATDAQLIEIDTITEACTLIQEMQYPILQGEDP